MCFGVYDFKRTSRRETSVSLHVNVCAQLKKVLSFITEGGDGTRRNFMLRLFHVSSLIICWSKVYRSLKSVRWHGILFPFSNMTLQSLHLVLFNHFLTFCVINFSSTDFFLYQPHAIAKYAILFLQMPKKRFPFIIPNVLTISSGFRARWV